MTENTDDGPSIREAHEAFQSSVDDIREKNGADDIRWESGDEWQRVTLFYGDVPEQKSIELTQDNDGFWRATDNENHRTAGGSERYEALRKLAEKLEQDYVEENFD